AVGGPLSAKALIDDAAAALRAIG
ncbi:MAG: hypothetical protein RJA16_920, partial [Planctomycetota bacterium]